MIINNLQDFSYLLEPGKDNLGEINRRVKECGIKDSSAVVESTVITVAEYKQTMIIEWQQDNRYKLTMKLTRRSNAARWILRSYRLETSTSN